VTGLPTSSANEYLATDITGDTVIQKYLSERNLNNLCFSEKCINTIKKA